MRRTTTVLLLTAALTAGAVGCSKSGDETAKDCATALTARTGGKPADTPTVNEAKERVDALDKTLAGMVRSGYETVAKQAADALEQKTKAGGKSRPGACKPLSEDDYTTLLMAKSIDGLGWTDEGGKFDKLKMADSLGS
ncbi:hypothetical protein [Streptomyces prunicolor]|uniref:hypothetical protein n=1 Tax=Streptomyces prunicolor TaxID=67348 RepID=UPI0003785DF8|nr:hypothetical protein [Streptomyces prunicolor]